MTTFRDQTETHQSNEITLSQNQTKKYFVIKNFKTDLKTEKIRKNFTVGTVISTVTFQHGNFNWALFLRRC